MQGGDTSIHRVLRSSSLVKLTSQESSKTIQTSQKSNSDYKGPVGQESTSYKGTTIDTCAVDGILRYSLREIDHVQIFAIGVVLRSKVKRKAMQSKVKHHFWWKSRVKPSI